MTPALDRLATARQPRQQRARERFEQVLACAHELLRAEGLAGFSIPAVAERLGYTRASIYKFFPTPHAVLNELARRSLDALEARLEKLAPRVLADPWPRAMRAMTLEAAAFHNGNPVARLLILGGPVSDESFRVQERTIQRLGELTRALFLMRGLHLPTAKPDAAMLAVDLGTTCFRVSQFLHGRITPEYAEEAVFVMEAYLRRYIQAPQ